LLPSILLRPWFAQSVNVPVPPAPTITGPARADGTHDVIAGVHGAAPVAATRREQRLRMITVTSDGLVAEPGHPRQG
jgi:hypothetical protein